MANDKNINDINTWLESRDIEYRRMYSAYLGKPPIEATPEQSRIWNVSRRWGKSGAIEALLKAQAVDRLHRDIARLELPRSLPIQDFEPDPNGPRLTIEMIDNAYQRLINEGANMSDKITDSSPNFSEIVNTDFMKQSGLFNAACETNVSGRIGSMAIGYTVDEVHKVAFSFAGASYAFCLMRKAGRTVHKRATCMSVSKVNVNEFRYLLGTTIAEVTFGDDRAKLTIADALSIGIDTINLNFKAGGIAGSTEGYFITDGSSNTMPNDVYASNLIEAHLECFRIAEREGFITNLSINGATTKAVLVPIIEKKEAILF